ICVKKDELEVALEKASMAANKTVIITTINKAYVEPYRGEYPSMFDIFLEGFWVGEETRPLLRHLLVVSMDSTSHERCQFRRLNCYRLVAEGGGDSFAGEKIYMSNEFIEMMWSRTYFLLDVLKRGYNFIFTIKFKLECAIRFSI
ncbi:Nucleotide-diphospho-sugar transferase family protein, partial [Perilla frutescens var. hirtella]